MIRHLASSLLLACLFLACGHALYTAALDSRDKAQTSHAGLQAESLQLQQRLRQTMQDEAAIRASIDRYDTLKSREVIGPEQRLAWADTTRHIQEALGLEEAGFSLGPQQVLNRGLGGNPRYSTMTWRAQLRHEEELLAFIEALARVDSAIVWPLHCTLGERSAADVRPGSLDTECQFEWITFNPEAGNTP